MRGQWLPLLLLAWLFLVSYSSSSSSSSTTQQQDHQNESTTSRVSNGKFLESAMAYHDSVAFLMAMQLGIPEWIEKQVSGSTTPTDIAKEYGLTVRAASALLVTLCRLDVVEIVEDSDDSVDDITYKLTAEAKYFLANPGHFQSTNAFIETFATNFFTPDKLLDASKPRKADEKDIMSQHLEENKDEADKNVRLFMRHMNAQSYSCAQALSKVLKPKLRENKKEGEVVAMLDVGGGSAIYPVVMAQTYPKFQGTILELENVVPITKEFISEAGFSDRITAVPGDFFTDEPFPGPVDFVLFSNILHDWPDDTNMHLMKQAYNCLRPGGSIVIAELLLADDVRSSTVSSTNMNIIMIPWTQGRQYRGKEIMSRLTKNGFINPTVQSLVDDYSVVMAEKPLVADPQPPGKTEL